MNGNTAEDKIRMKVEPIDTLQAGIVYGKEDAWDRLQSRLDAKPVRKTLPWHKLTTAAAALLLVTGTGYFLLMNGGKEHLPGVRSSYQGALSDAENIVLHKTTDVSITTTTVQDSYTTITVHTAPTHPLPQPQQPQILNNEPYPVVIAEEKPTPVAPQPVAPPKMKVVHINELGQQEDKSVHDAWEEKNPFPHVQFPMTVVHINDIGRPLTQEEYMRKAEKTAVWRLPRGHNSVYDAGDQPRRLFRINLSTSRNNEKTTFNTGAGMDTDSTEPVVY